MNRVPEKGGGRGRETGSWVPKLPFRVGNALQKRGESGVAGRAGHAVLTGRQALRVTDVTLRQCWVAVAEGDMCKDVMRERTCNVRIKSTPRF